MTTNDTKNLRGVELALALDLLDESPVDRLWEDEDGIFTEADASMDWDDVPSYMYGIGGF
jgi:hypothetical protein